ncbi:MAG: hypothetical protein ABEI52_04455 [Halobacteriaceae archaeon]
MATRRKLQLAEPYVIRASYAAIVAGAIQGSVEIYVGASIVEMLPAFTYLFVGFIVRAGFDKGMDGRQFVIGQALLTLLFVGQGGVALTEFLQSSPGMERLIILPVPVAAIGAYWSIRAIEKGR